MAFERESKPINNPRDPHIVHTLVGHTYYMPREAKMEELIIGGERIDKATFVNLFINLDKGCLAKCFDELLLLGVPFDVDGVKDWVEERCISGEKI